MERYRYSKIYDTMKEGSGNIRGNSFFLFVSVKYVYNNVSQSLVKYLDIEVCEKQSRKVVVGKI